MANIANDDLIAYLTQEGLEELKKEIKDLKEKKRPAVLKRLSEARDKGDLSENADYTGAKEELEFLDSRLDEIEDILQRSKVITQNTSGKKVVQLGTKATVSVKGKEHTFTVVGEWEADPMEKKISHDSPLGKALIGKKEGDVVEVDAPVGKITYTIKTIH